MAPYKIAIIGTAGRNSDAPKMNLAIFEAMLEHARSTVDRIRTQMNLRYEDITLVSGGSAWSDHLAVRLFLDICSDKNYGGLHLYLPCSFVVLSNQIVFDSSDSCGKRLNTLHTRFNSAVMPFYNSFADLHTAHYLAAKLDTSKLGFHSRNTEVAKADAVIAYTWGTDPRRPADGGTKDTWDKSRATIKIHVPLNTLPNATGNTTTIIKFLSSSNHDSISSDHKHSISVATKRKLGDFHSQEAVKNKKHYLNKAAAK